MSANAFKGGLRYECIPRPACSRQRMILELEFREDLASTTSRRQGRLGHGALGERTLMLERAVEVGQISSPRRIRCYARAAWERVELGMRARNARPSLGRRHPPTQCQGQAKSTEPAADRFLSTIGLRDSKRPARLTIASRLANRTYDSAAAPVTSAPYGRTAEGPAPFKPSKCSTWMAEPHLHSELRPSNGREARHQGSDSNRDRRRDGVVNSILNCGPERVSVGKRPTLGTQAP